MPRFVALRGRLDFRHPWNMLLPHLSFGGNDSAVEAIKRRYEQRPDADRTFNIDDWKVILKSLGEFGR